MLARKTPRVVAEERSALPTDSQMRHRALGVYDTLQAHDFLSQQHDWLLWSSTWPEQRSGRPVTRTIDAVAEG